MNNDFKIYCDGGSRGNPGPAASAFVVEKEGKTFYKEGKAIGIATNNIAEYNGAILGLTWLVENKKEVLSDEAIFILDSELVSKQLAGLFKIKNEKLRSLYFIAKELEKKIDKKIIYKNVSRDKNKLADFLVNQTLDKSPSLEKI